MIQSRTAWLGRPWFLTAVALLALNDHVLKPAWPGLVTGKLSDLAGVVVVGTLAAVLLGRTRGILLAGLGFAALKTVPGVAEAAAPILGGVTLRDPWDLVALLVAPLLWVGLGVDRPDQPVRDRRGRQLLGLLAAVLATSATSAPLTPPVELMSSPEGGLHAGVYLHEFDETRWLVSFDGGATWQREDDPGLPSDPAGGRILVTCAADGVCYRAGATAGGTMVERLVPGGPWLIDGLLPGGARSLEVERLDSNKVVATRSPAGMTSYRDHRGAWRQLDLAPLASANEWPRDWQVMVGSRPGTALVFVAFGLLAVLVARQPSLRIVIAALTPWAWLGTFGLSYLFPPRSIAGLVCTWSTVAVAAAVASRLVARLSRSRTGARGGVEPPGFDPPSGAG